MEPPDEVIEKTIYFNKDFQKRRVGRPGRRQKKRMGKGKDKKAGDKFAEKALDYLADGYDDGLSKIC